MRIRMRRGWERDGNRDDDDNYKDMIIIIIGMTIRRGKDKNARSRVTVQENGLWANDNPQERWIHCLRSGPVKVKTKNGEKSTKQISTEIKIRKKNGRLNILSEQSQPVNPGEQVQQLDEEYVSPSQ